MALLDEMRAQKLKELARGKFKPEISEAEIKVLQDSASSLDVDDPGEDVARPEVRADFLRWLVTDAEAVKWLDRVQPAGEGHVSRRGRRVEWLGRLDECESETFCGN